MTTEVCCLMEGGAFDTFELRGSSHYEVHGETTSDTLTPASTEPPVRFAFRCRQSASASTSSPSGLQALRDCGVKMMQRSVFVAEVTDGALKTQKTITVKYSEFESSVASIKAKVVDALGQEEPIVLIDSEGTRGPAFWKQHARKIYAVPEGQLQRLRGTKRRRESRQKDNGLPSVLDQIEEVVLASQGLQDISKIQKDLVQFVQANQHTALCLNKNQAEAVRAAFACITCKDPMKEPMFADRCRGLLGCQSCSSGRKAILTVQSVMGRILNSTYNQLWISGCYLLTRLISPRGTIKAVSILLILLTMFRYVNTVPV